MALVSRRLPATEEEKKAKLKERSQAAYAKAKEEMRVMKVQLEGFVMTKKMSQEEADSVLLSRLHGQYREKHKKQIAERKVKEAKQELQSTNETHEKDWKAYEELQTHSNQMRGHFKGLHESYISNQ